MLSRIRRHFRFANVVMVLVLVFAMSGGAYAAKRYLITSTKQISPKVLSTLKGNSGKNGAPGPAGAKGETGAPGPGGKEGAPGKNGEDGKEGTAGKNGENGKEGSPWTAGGT